MKKRASFRLPAEVIERAIELRLQGWTVRAIAKKVGYSKTAIHDAVRGVPVGQASSADDLERAGELSQLVEEATLVARGMIREYGKRLQGHGPKLSSRDLTALTRAITEFQKLSALLRGQVTSRTEMVRREEPEPTDEERETMDRLSRLMEEDER